jgi:LysM repeat protein
MKKLLFSFSIVAFLLSLIFTPCAQSFEVVGKKSVTMGENYAKAPKVVAAPAAASQSSVQSAPRAEKPRVVVKTKIVRVQVQEYVPVPSDTNEYVVRKGDTVSGIARMIGSDGKTLFALNGLNEKSARRIQPGQKLQVPGKKAEAKIAELEKNFGDVKQKLSEANETIRKLLITPVVSASPAPVASKPQSAVSGKNPSKGGILRGAFSEPLILQILIIVMAAIYVVTVIFFIFVCRRVIRGCNTPHAEPTPAN